jgi:hypothetical protein
MSILTCNTVLSIRVQMLSHTRKAILLIPLRLSRSQDKYQLFNKSRIHTTLELVLIKPEININSAQQVCALSFQRRTTDCII